MTILDFSFDPARSASAQEEYGEPGFILCLSLNYQSKECSKFPIFSLSQDITSKSGQPPFSNFMHEPKRSSTKLEECSLIHDRRLHGRCLLDLGHFAVCDQRVFNNRDIF